jgi:hypothetical protein
VRRRSAAADTPEAREIARLRALREVEAQGYRMQLQALNLENADLAAAARQAEQERDAVLEVLIAQSHASARATASLRVYGVEHADVLVWTIASGIAADAPGTRASKVRRRLARLIYLLTIRAGKPCPLGATPEEIERGLRKVLTANQISKWIAVREGLLRR